MKKKLIFSTLLLFGTMPHAWAQHEGIVLDMETRQPLAGVKVYTNTNKMYMTDRQGHFSITDRTTRSVTFSHSSYVKRTLNLTNYKDTVLLLPKDITINTVVITAKAPTIMKSAPINASTVISKDPLLKPSSPTGYNFLWFLERGSKVPGKVMRKAHEAVKNYTPDPNPQQKDNEQSTALPRTKGKSNCHCNTTETIQPTLYHCRDCTFRTHHRLIGHSFHDHMDAIGKHFGCYQLHCIRVYTLL